MKYLIIHGHFYQPPRENPFLGVIPREPSAAPSHDWNERITNECYSPNAYSRVLDGFGRIIKVINNYEYLSFNFGPTLMDYIAETRTDIINRIVSADQKSIERLGFGNAIAQVYNHIILPLACKEDMRVQIKWGLYNFEKYFKRRSRGIWLSETAINKDVVDAMFDCNIAFTVLSPYQAHFVKNDNGSVTDVSNAKIDCSKPYWLYGNGGKRVAVFFYDGYLSRSVAFEHLLTSADKFASYIRTGFSDGEKQMVNIATDGESYGHHEAFGDMCLASYITDNIHREAITITNYEHYLSICPPTTEVILLDGEGGRGTSWSCSHGVERWRSNCGCGSNEAHWRTPLREAFDVLRALQDRLFFDILGINQDSRASLREEYVRAMYNEEAATDLYEICENHVSYFEFMFLMEAYKYAMFAYTSCGWFFEDVSRIEPRQNMQYAERSFYYARLLARTKPVSTQVETAYKEFLELLDKSISNIEPTHSAKYYFEKSVLDDEYSELYVINQFVFMELAGAHNSNPVKIRDYEIFFERLDAETIKGELKHKYALTYYFKTKTFVDDQFEIKNDIWMSKDKASLFTGSKFTLPLKDVAPEIRDKLAQILFQKEIVDTEDAYKYALPFFENLFAYYEANKIIPDHDYKRIMGAICSPVLRSKIEKNGRASYDDVSSTLGKLRLADIFVSTSGISSKISENIKNSLIEVGETKNEALFEEILKDIKFLSINDMPIDRHAFENMFYKIIQYDRDSILIMNQSERENYIELGKWLNFNMDVLGKH